MEEGHIQATRVVSRTAGLIAPDLIVAEVANVAWKKTLRDEIDWEDAECMVEGVTGSMISLVPNENIAILALRIAKSLQHPVYDCHYLACSWLHEQPLLTADTRLCRTVEGTPFEKFVFHLARV